ncbi:hypothetical protein ACI5KX_14170 [Erythrobacter sp. GH1-10]|uniref:hypothetical protein n=1 Tax=Erythrobacter sp. GH1-10 TaxID=3349334 RepID=UPI003877F4A0
MTEDAAGRDEYYVIPEEALSYLPREWREQLQTMADDGRAILKSVDSELSQLSRLTIASVNLVTLKHIKERLTEYRFAPTMEAIFENEMLVTAFVVTYARLQQGGVGSGFARGALPEHLRSFHDEILELRNKRFAHNAGHHTIKEAMEINFRDGRFEVQLGSEVRIQIGGAPEWQELVDFLDGLVADRMDRVIAKLTEKTGSDWSLPKGPAPEEIERSE